MLTLRKRSFDAYRANLGAIEGAALSGFRAKVAKASLLFMTAKDEQQRSVPRSFIADEVYGRIDLSSAKAQALADDMFEAMTGNQPAPHEAMPYEAADSRVRSAAVHLFEEGSTERFISVLETFIRQEVRGAASNAIAENVENENNRRK